MSTHDTRFGGSGGRSLEYGSDFAEGQNADDAYGQSWNASASNSQKSEVSSMVQGAGRPGQPNIGQRSIFGNGGAAFTQMPTYTPTTRASEPKQPEPQQTYQPQSPPQPAPQPRQPASQTAQPQQTSQHQMPAQTQPQNFGGHPQYQPQSFQQPAQYAQHNSAAAFDEQDFDLSGADPNFPDSIFGDFMPDAGAEPDLALSDVEPEADATFPEDGNFAG
jgi:type IV secretory pathway VirB10-like protein